MKNCLVLLRARGTLYIVGICRDLDKGIGVICSVY